MERTNALAELAERLKKQIETTVYVSPQNRKDIVATQRIVAELAKVFVKSPIGDIWLDPNVSWSATLIKCRVIAEKGAGDGD